MADGSNTSPITFTSALPSKFLPQTGTWGGLIIMGQAPVAGGTQSVEGLSGYTYGGTNSADNSGVLRYVRVWYGGSVIGADNEINGITLAGVGSGTTVENCEVAFNKDDGFEMFGGTVNLKRISVLFAGDDAIDTDLGYNGKIQFAFVLVGKNGHHAAEMDSTRASGSSQYNGQPRSFPQLYNALFVGHTTGNPASASSDDQQAALLRLREGTGGEFGNLIIVNVGSGTDGIYQDSCGSETRTQTLPSNGQPNYLWLSKNNIITGPGNQYEFASGCAPISPVATAVSNDPGLTLMPIDTDVNTMFMDPRPRDNSIAFNAVDSVPSDGFFDSVTFKGAFNKGAGLWLSGLSWLDANARIPVDDDSTFLCENISSDTTWRKSTSYNLGCQVFVSSGATLTIEAGTTIKAYRSDIHGRAPSVIVKPGAKILASGTELAPITFTSAVSTGNLPARGLWGGLIIMGRAPVFGGTQEVEGIIGETYGGTDATDNSGVLQYVRVWYGGAVIGANNEINGITLAGVGSGTVVDHCEVAFNQDDGIEMFGGTVDLKYVTALFCGDDGLDTDLGYRGRIQFAFVMIGQSGHHGAEMDGNKDAAPNLRSFPRVYNALFVGHLKGNPQSISSDDQENAILRLREATGGEFGNIILSNVGSYGVFQDECRSEIRTQTMPTATFEQDSNNDGYLWFSANNIINGPGLFYYQSPGCRGLTQARNENPPLRLMPGTADNTSVVNPGPFRYLTETELFPSPAYSNVDAVPQDDFFDAVTYKGAFATGDDNLWIRRWSWLAANNQLSSESHFQQVVVDNSKSLSKGAIAGIVISVLFLVVVIAFVVYKYAFKKGHRYGVHENTIIGAMDHNPTFSLPKVRLFAIMCFTVGLLHLWLNGTPLDRPTKFYISTKYSFEIQIDSCI
eukprot:m.126451 g.126451  ORF g.126451 m.126451 type:complete len:905 (-) comp17371_c0_seq10:59-2773(-)